jgi:hypothetical protein
LLSPLPLLAPPELALLPQQVRVRSKPPGQLPEQTLKPEGSTPCRPALVAHSLPLARCPLLPAD